MLVVKCFNSLFEGKCGLYASFYKSWKIKLQVIEIWIRWAWTKSLLSLAYMIKIQEKRDGDTMGTHLPAPHASTSHRGGWLSQTSFTLVEPPAHALRLSMGEFLHGRAWKEGTEASGWRSNQRRGPGRVLRAPSPGRTCSTQTPPLIGGAFLSHLPWLSFCVTDACSRGKQRNGLRKWITERAPGNEFWAPFIFSNQKPFPPVRESPRTD